MASEQPLPAEEATQAAPTPVSQEPVPKREESPPAPKDLAEPTQEEAPATSDAPAPSATPATPSKKPKKTPATPKSSGKKRRLPSSAASTPKGTPGSTASKKLKHTHRRAHADEETPLRPGVSRDTTTYGTFWKQEARTAAYCSYIQRDEFRKFSVSPLVLKHYVHAWTDRGSIQVRQEQVLAYIRDMDEHMASKKSPIDQYPRQQDNVHAKQRMALAVAQMYRELREPVPQTPTYTEQEYERIITDFQKLTGQKPPRIDVAEVDKNRRPMGPFADHGEDELEGYNRCFHVLMYLNYSLSPAKWSSRFRTVKWAEPVRVNRQDMPHWMRERSESSHKPVLAPDQTDPDAEPPKPTCRVTVVWNNLHKGEQARELWDYLVAEGLAEDQNQDLNVKIDVLPTMTRAEVRDLIRVRFDMPNISAQINGLFTAAGQNIMRTEWSEIQEELWKAQDGTSSWRMHLRKTIDGEEIWEHQEVPGLSKTVLTTEGGDVGPLPPPPEPATAPVPTTDADTDDVMLDNIAEMLTEHASVKVDFLDGMIDKHFKDRPEDLLKFFTIDGKAYDVRTPDGLLAYQQKAFDKVTKSHKQILVEDAKSTKWGKRKLSKEQVTKLSEAADAGRMAALSLPDDPEEKRHYTLNAMYSGTQSQVGLPLNPSAIALQMTAFTDKKGRLMYRCDLPGLQKLSLYPYQVSGIATCLVRIYGYIPTPPDAPKSVKDAAEKLKGLALGCIFICDSTGMGKSILLLALFYLAQQHRLIDENGNRFYEFMKLAVPSGVIRQWADEILDNFPDLKLIISYDEASLPGRYADLFVKATAVRNMDHPELWPERFRYLFDSTNPDVGRTVILTSQDTLVKRTLEDEEYQLSTGVLHDPPQFDADKNVIWKSDPVMGTRQVGTMRGVGFAACDEAQRLKDRETQRWKAFSELDARHVLIIGATMMANTGTDAVAQLELAWPCIERELDKATGEEKDWVNSRKRSMTMYIDGLEDIKDPFDRRKLGYLHPSTVRRLLDKGTHAEHAKYFPLVADLLCLTRSMSSRIPLDFVGDKYYECKVNLKPVICKTVYTDFLPEEKREQQYQHRDAARRFVKMSRASSKKAGKDDRPVYPVAEMRELLLGSASTKVRVFNDQCKRAGRDSLTESMEAFRENGFDGWAYVRFVCEQSGVQPPRTGVDYFVFMCEGSPLLRAVLSEIFHFDRFLKPLRQGKLFILDDVPLVAMFLYWALNMLGIDTALFHSGLGNAERDELQQDFNDPKSRLAVMVCLYDVGGVGRNFHKDCHYALLTSAGKNQAAETQGTGRLVRAPQEHDVTVTKVFIRNSICGFREARKRDKAMVEFATRASDPDIASLLVDVLNERQQLIEQTQKDPKNQELLEKLRRRREIFTSKTELQLAGAVPDANDLVVTDVVEGKRKRMQVDRYDDADFDEVTGDRKRVKQEDVSGDKDENGVKAKEEVDEKELDLTAKEEVDETESLQNQFLSDPAELEEYEGASEDDDFVDDSFIDDDEDFEDGALDSDDEDLEDNFKEEAQGSDGDYDDDIPSASSDADSLIDGARAGAEDESEAENAQTAKAKRKALKAQRDAMREEQQDDEDLRRLKRLLTADASRVYTKNDLQNSTTLKLALKLAYCARHGLKFDEPTSIHIEYTSISPNLQAGIEADVKVDKDRRRQLLELLERGQNQAPDAAQAPRKSAAATNKEGAAVRSSQSDPIKKQVLEEHTEAELKARILAVFKDQDLAGWSKEEMIAFIDGKNMEMYRKKSYDDWPSRLLWKEASQRGLTLEDGMDKDGVVEMLEEDDFLRKWGA